MNEISGWFPLCYRKIFTPLPPTPNRDLALTPISVPLSTISPILQMGKLRLWES